MNKNMKHLSLVLLALVSVASAKSLRSPQNVAGEHPCNFDASHNFELYVVQSPLFFEQYGHLFTKLDIYHTGIVLKDLVTGYECSVEYAAIDFVSANFPSLDDSEGVPIQKKIKWDGTTRLFINDDKVPGYWQKRDLFTTISGEMVAKIFTFSSQYVREHPNYLLGAVVNADTTSTFIPSSNCFDYVHAVLRFVAKAGAKFVPAAYQVKRNNVYIHTTAPVAVRLDDPKHTEEILGFYRIFKYDPKVDGIDGLYERALKLANALFLPKAPMEFYMMQGAGKVFSYNYLPFQL